MQGVTITDIIEVSYGYGLWLDGVFFCDRDYKGNKKCGPAVFWKDRRVFSKAQPSVEQA